MPDLKKKEDNQWGGIKLTYKIYKSFYVSILKRHFNIFNLYLGTQSFLRPFKRNWDKKTYRLQRPYWGKVTHPLTRLWVVLYEPNSVAVNTSNNKRKVIPKASLIHQHIELFNIKFQSKDLSKKLRSCSNKFQLSSIN